MNRNATLVCQFNGFPGRNLSVCKKRSFETSVRHCNRGLSRRSEDYGARILPTARRYYGWVQLPRNPDRRNDGGDGVVHDSWSSEATGPHARSSFWPVRELAVTFSSPYAEIIPCEPFSLSSPSSLFLSVPLLFDVCVRLVPAGTLTGFGLV